MSPFLPPLSENDKNARLQALDALSNGQGIPYPSQYQTTPTANVSHPAPVPRPGGSRAPAATPPRHRRIDAESLRRAAQGQWRSILARLGIAVPDSPKKHGPCPACGGKDRFRFDDQEGRGTWFCNQCNPKAGNGFALVMNVKRVPFGEAAECIADAIGYGREPRQVKTTQSAAGAPPRIMEFYDYVDESGKRLFQVVRYKPKDFRQRRPDGNGGWIWNLQGVEPVLYKLPQVIAANSILILEGEKDADTADKIGLPERWAASCNAMGAGKWKDSYSDALAGKHITILPDADEPGEKHAVQVAQSLTGKADTVNVLRLPAGYKDLSE